MEVPRCYCAKRPGKRKALCADQVTQMVDCLRQLYDAGSRYPHHFGAPSSSKRD
jgi:hypothetical protein